MTVIRFADVTIDTDTREQRVIRTMHGRGYWFVAALDDEPAEGAAGEAGRAETASGRPTGTESTDSGAEPDGTKRAVDLYATAMDMAVEHGLAPFALEIIVGVAELVRQEPTPEQVERLRGVLGRPAATSAVRERAATLLGEPDGDVTRWWPSAERDWRQTARESLAGLAGRPDA